MRFWRDVGEAMTDGFRAQQWKDWASCFPRRVRAGWPESRWFSA